MGAIPNLNKYLQQMRQFVGFPLKIVTKDGEITGTLVRVNVHTKNVMVENGTIVTSDSSGKQTTSPFDCILVYGDSILFYHIAEPTNPPS